MFMKTEYPLCFINSVVLNFKRIKNVKMEVSKKFHKFTNNSFRIQKQSPRDVLQKKCS